MLKGVTHVTLEFGTILLICADLISGGCPSGTIHISDLCYKWHAKRTSSMYNARVACLDEGGRLAGPKGTFLETLEENPILEDYLPKENCYWADIPSPETRTSGYPLLRSVLPKIYTDMLAVTLQAYYNSYICFRGGKWMVHDVRRDTQNYFVCQYDVSIFNKVRRLPDVKMKVVRMAKDSTFVVGQPLFVNRTPLPTMCSRLCQGITACSMFNYNKVTKECRGFGGMENTCIHYHRDWQLWMFD